MEPEDSNSSTTSGGGSQRAGFTHGCSCGRGEMMKRSESELALEEFVRMATIAPADPSSDDSLKTDGGDPCFLPPASAATDLSSAFSTWEMAHVNEPSSGGLGVPLWYQILMTKHSSILTTNPTQTDSQSSVFVGSAMSASKPKVRDGQGREATIGFSCEQSDDDGEIEPGSCEQSAGPNDNHSRRKIYNRESARRSRKRKQEHFAGLEIQVEHLTGENETLFKQLTDAAQQFRDANTNNRVLKSDVEALRAKVTLAEDMVARGSINCSFNHLLQNLNLQPSINIHSGIGRIASVSPSVTIHRDNDSSFTSGSTITRQNSCIRVENGNSGNSSTANGIMSESLSCVSGIWQ